MNETKNNILAEAEQAAAVGDLTEEVKTAAAVLPPLSENEAASESTAGEEEKTGTEADEKAPAIGEKEAGELVSHPMFAHYARGRQEPFDEILRSFGEMLRAYDRNDSREVLKEKMTPMGGHVTADVDLTERQRSIARAAGMSYREYYELMTNK